ncbi:AAA family ATPase [Loktanella agnita]|uniref:AAA family ATPase n=1 Tax=Loktanella agnita TaxID=287097 RepID=UPI003987AB2C
MPAPTLHLFCGKIAAGKSTLAAKLAQAPLSVLIAEDAWLQALFAEELKTGPDYLRCAFKLRSAVGDHVAELLGAGVSVVLDFQGNTIESRAWMRGIIDRTGASHQLHLLAPPDAVCLARMHARNAQGDHPFAATEAQFHRFSKHFIPPAPEEGFNVVSHDDVG